MKLSQNPKLNGFENVLLHIHTTVVVLNTLGNSNKLLKKSCPVLPLFFIQTTVLSEHSPLPFKLWVQESI